MAKLRSRIALVMLLVFPYAAAIGIFKNLSNSIIIAFFIVSVCLEFTQLEEVFHLIQQSRTLLFWVMYLITVVASTLAFRKLSDPHIIFIDLLVFISVILLMIDVKLETYLSYFKGIVIGISWISIAGYISGIKFFDFLRSSSVLSTLNTSIDGLTGPFEYRHYYGIFLVVALLIQIIIPSNKLLLNSMNVFSLSVNLILTYTRSDWIAFSVALIIMFFVKARKGIKLIYIQTMIGVAVVLALAYIAFFNQIQPVLVDVSRRINDVFNTSDFGGARAYSFTAGIKYILVNWYKYLWIGGGTGFALAWLSAFPFDGWWTSAIDCQYVTSFMETGVVGIGLLLLLIVLGFWYSVSENSFPIQKLFGLSFVAMSVAIFFFDVIGTPTSVFVLWNILICGMAITQSDRQFVRREEKSE